MSNGQKENWKKETPALTEFEITEAIRFADMLDKPDCHGIMAPNYRVLRLVQDRPALKTIIALRHKVKALSQGSSTTKQ